MKHFQSPNDNINEKLFKENNMFTEEQFDHLAKKYMDTVFQLAFNYTKVPIRLCVPGHRPMNII